VFAQSAPSGVGLTGSERTSPHDDGREVILPATSRTMLEGP
jgi:hypothetical protein